MLTELELPIPPLALMRGAVAAVWLYEGTWCKLLGRAAAELQVVQSVPFFGARSASLFLLALGAVETGLGLWVLSGWQSGMCTLAQAGLLAGLNSAGILWARHRIHDPPGMVLKNIALLVLAWVCAAMHRGAP